MDNESELNGLDEQSLNQVEKELELVGITAVEDLLQDDVASCIRDFRLAGIKVWMLTGDKGETALEIGLRCGLYDKQKMEVLKVEESTEIGVLQENLSSLVRSI